MLVFRELFGFPTLRVRQWNWHYFVSERSALPRRLRELLRSQRKLVHTSAIELVALGKILGGLCHTEAYECVGETLPKNIFHHGRLSERRSPPQSPSDV